jgi:hypothetical protein
MSVQSRQVLQYWLGDSHLAEHHHVPSQYGLVCKEHPDESQRYSTSPELYHVRGGRRLDDDWVATLCKEIQWLDGVPRNFVISCGTNNLRRANHWDTMEDILNWYRILIDAIKKASAATLLIISPIPDNTTKTDWIGEILDAKLRDLCWSERPRVRYVSFRSRKLRFQRGICRWNPDLFHDDVHLNREGARLLAEMILQQQANFPNDCYGIGESGPSVAKRVKAESQGNTIRPGDARFGLSGNRHGTAGGHH